MSKTYTIKVSDAVAKIIADLTERLQLVDPEITEPQVVHCLAASLAGSYSMIPDAVYPAIEWAMTQESSASLDSAISTIQECGIPARIQSDVDTLTDIATAHFADSPANRGPSH